MLGLVFAMVGLAPIDGTVLTLYHEPGAYVTSGTPLALVGDFGILSFTVPMEDRYVRRLAVEDTAQIFFRSKDLQKVYGTEYGAGNMGMGQEFFAHITEITRRRRLKLSKIIRKRLSR